MKITIQGNDKTTKMVLIRNDKGIVLATVYVDSDKNVSIDSLQVLPTDPKSTLDLISPVLTSINI